MTTRRAASAGTTVWPRLLPGLALALLAAPAGAFSWTSCLDPGIEPPAPLEREPPAYPEAARQVSAEGSVEVAFTVLRDGSVGWARILKAEPSGFFEAAALDGVRGWRFTPPRRDGEVVECRIRTRLRFALADGAALRADGEPGTDGLPAPAYPPAARAARLEGYAEVGFTIGEDGRVTRAEVLAAMPRGEFEAAALAAVRRWRLPAGEAGKSLRRRFEFSLPDAPPRPPAATLLASAPLPAEACAQATGGWVRLEIEADPQGRVTAARLVAAQPAGLFDAVAPAIALRSRVAPAWRDGHPVAATGLLTLFFSPDDSACPGAASGERTAPARRAPAPRVTGLPPDATGQARAATIVSLAAARRPPPTPETPP